MRTKGWVQNKEWFYVKDKEGSVQEFSLIINSYQEGGGAL